MPKLFNRVYMGTATTGTGTITLGSAETGFQTFASAGVTDGDVVRYTIEDGDAWEIGEGTYTASGTTLSRTLLESSTGSLLSLTGSAKVFIDAAAEDLAQGAVEVFTTSGTWTKPESAKWVYVELVAGGGSGGKLTSADGVASGGGGGSYADRWFLADDLPSSVDITIGAGGAGVSGASDAFGNNGGDTTFSTYLTASRGWAGRGSTSLATTGGASGNAFLLSGSSGYANGIGGGGGYGDGITIGRVGGSNVKGGGGGGASVSTGGGGSIAGGGGVSVDAGNGGVGGSGGDGVYPGGGGGGLRSSDSGTTSGSGAAGRAKVWVW